MEVTESSTNGLRVGRNPCRGCPKRFPTENIIVHTSGTNNRDKMKWRNFLSVSEFGESVVRTLYASCDANPADGRIPRF